MPGSGADLGARLRGRDLTAAPATLNLVESRTPAARAEVAALLREVSPGALGGEAPAHVVGARRARAEGAGGGAGGPRARRRPVLAPLGRRAARRSRPHPLRPRRRRRLHP